MVHSSFTPRGPLGKVLAVTHTFPDLVKAYHDSPATFKDWLLQAVQDGEVWPRIAARMLAYLDNPEDGEPTVSVNQLLNIEADEELLDWLFDDWRVTQTTHRRYRAYLRVARQLANEDPSRVE
jgi:hypothetical protein